MALTAFPNGVSSFGVPVMGGVSIPTSTGNYFFVDSGAGTDSAATSSGFGKSPDRPFATIDFAIGQCSDNNGDIIVVMPGHTEALSGASAITVDVAGVQIIGLGTGNSRPALTWETAATTIVVSSASCRISNFRLITGAEEVVVGIDVNAAGFVFDNNRMGEQDADSDEFLRCIDLATATDAVIRDNFFFAPSGDEANEFINLDTSHRFICVNNFMCGDLDDAAIMDSNTASADILIAYNLVVNTASSGGAAIDLDTACTGMIAYNGLAELGTGLAGLDPGSCMTIENYIVNAVDEHGAIVPAATST